MKFIQDLNDNIYNLEKINGFLFEYEEENNSIEILIEIGNQRYLLASEIELDGYEPQDFYCDFVRAIISSKQLIVSQKRIFIIIDAIFKDAIEPI